MTANVAVRVDEAVASTEAVMHVGEREATTSLRMPRWKGALIALGSLVLVYGIGLGVMAAGGAVLHAVKPTKAVDAFTALHNRWVLGVLGGIAVLWLLPPYPWARHVAAQDAPTQPVQQVEIESETG